MATYTDDFNRADETPLSSGTWGLSGTGSFNLASNQCSHPTDASDNEVYYVSASALGDCYAQVTIVQDGNAGAESGCGVVCRHIGSSTRTFIRCVVDGNGDMTVRTYTNGSSTLVGTRTSGFADGDTVRMEVSGTSPNIVVKIFHNGVQEGADFTGVSGPNTGKPGMCYSSTINVAGLLDNWSAGDLGGTDYTATVPNAAAASASGPVPLVSTLTRPYVLTTIA